MTTTENSSTTQSHGKLIAVVIAAAVVIILAVLSAFVWPGWALNKSAATGSTTTQTGDKKQTAKAEPTTPSIKATALPDDATELLKSMPDSVLNYARTKAEASATWSAASPLEEYTLTYAVGTDTNDITLISAQWSTADSAKTQYDALVAAQTGDESASGNVKVSGNVTGAYVVKTDASDSKKSVAIWQNDTVVFQATGSTDAIDRFYQQFPM
ncbi:hypothetical protein [Bifidobacterium olomucense]|nr:hypothetical protein [Bifidobacterium sp. DSM 109959]